MDVTKKTYQTIDEYLLTVSPEVVKILESLRKIIKEESPDITEAISYGMPTFKLHGKNLVHFAAWKNHIGFYPTASGTKEFEKELEQYTYSKGSIHFPLDKPLPVPFIKKIVQFRVKEVLKKN